MPVPPATPPSAEPPAGPPPNPDPIATAACEAVGLPGDYEMLTVLRTFRDTVLARTEEGRQEIARYYATAPAIVAAIDARPDARQVYRALMELVIAPATADILAGRHEEARQRYRQMLARLAAATDPWSALDGG